ncbi:MAG: virulence RhuM family protein, partial [Flavobacteriaceae bacterium]|nr:virulence RhuM family protein [Flavobacteriaceae bacterium]
MNNEFENESHFLFYQGNDGKIKIQVILGDETVWVTQNAMAEIFGIDKSGISRHLKNIFEEGELQRDSVVAKNATTGSDGKTYEVEFYNLDAIISVGYRVSSYKATRFRIWATSVLKEYMIKGFALDDERLKQSDQLFGKDYFKELLERIREIRASERLFYQKVTDIYATSIDYDPHSPITQEFYATVQNKLHWAIHHHTAAELIRNRADSGKPNMGLTSWKNEKKGGKILKTDVSIAKNYLSKEELSELNTVVTMYLDFAENMARRQKEMKMVDWVSRLDAFLDFNEYDVLEDAGRISAKAAKTIAEAEYAKFRVIQDREYRSDFDKVIENIKITGKLPSEKLNVKSISEDVQKSKEKKEQENLSDF